MSNTTADKTTADCALQFLVNSDDCNNYVKAVWVAFFEPDLSTNPNMNAYAIFAEIKTSRSWKDLNKKNDKAIASVKSGDFVITGMISTKLSDWHGRLAIIIGVEGIH